MRNLYLILFSFFSFLGFSQEDAWVYFNGKPNAQYYFDNPLQMLSQRSLDRRVNQNIALDIKDIPIHQPYVDQISASTGILVKAKSKWLNAVHVRGAVDDIQNLTSLSFVDYVQFADRTLNVSGKIKRNPSSKSIKKINKLIRKKFTIC